MISPLSIKISFLFILCSFSFIVYVNLRFAREFAHLIQFFAYLVRTAYLKYKLRQCTKITNGINDAIGYF